MLPPCTVPSLGAALCWLAGCQVCIKLKEIMAGIYTSAKAAAKEYGTSLAAGEGHCLSNGEHALISMWAAG